MSSLNVVVVVAGELIAVIQPRAADNANVRTDTDVTGTREPPMFDVVMRAAAVGSAPRKRRANASRRGACADLSRARPR